MASKNLEYLLSIRDEATKTLQKFASESKNIGKGMEDVGRSISDAGVGFAKIGAAGVAGLGLATKSAMNFDSQLRNIQSISKSTEAEIQSMGKTFIGLSKELPQTATQLAEGFYNIQGSGFAGADALKVLDASARAASAGLTTTEASSYAITSALNAYGMGADQAKAVSDTLFKTVDIGVVSFEQLSGTIGDVLGTASNMGVGIDQVGAAIAGMTKKGIGASEATTSLNATLLGFMKPSDAMASSLSALGYKSGQAMLAEMDLGQAIMMVRKHAEDNGQTVNDLFGNVRALKGVLALTSDEAVQFSKDLKLMQGSTKGVGATQEAFAKQQKGAAFQAKIFANNLSAIGIIVGNSILPTINDLMAKMTPLIEKFSAFAEKNPKLIVGILALVASFAVFGGILIFVGQMIMAVGAIMTFLGGIVGGSLIGAFISFFAVLAGVGAIVALVISNWDSIKNKAIEISDAIKTKFAEPFKGYMEAMGGQAEAFKERLADSFGISIEDLGVTALMGKIKDTFKKGIDEVAKQVRQGLKNMYGKDGGDDMGGITDIFGKIMGVVVKVSDLFYRVLTPAIENVKKAFEESKPEIDKLLQALGPAFVGILTVTFGVIAGLIVVVLGVISGLINAFSEALPSIIQFFSGIVQFISGFFNLIIGLFTLNGQLIVDSLIQMGKGIYNVIVGAFTAVTKFIWGFITGIIQFFQTIYDVLVGNSIVPDMVNAIIDWFTNLWNSVIAIVDLLVQGVILFFTNLKDNVVKIWTEIKNKASELWNLIKTNIVNFVISTMTKLVILWNSIKTSLVNKWNEISTKAKEAWDLIKDKILTAVKTAWTNLVSEFEAWKSSIYDWGENIAQSFVEGFKNAINGIKQAAIDAFEAAKGVVMGKSPPKEGPFKNIDQWGFNIGDAWVNGFEESLRQLPSRFDSASSGVTNDNSRVVNLNISSPNINTPMDAEEFALILGNQIAVSGTY